MPEERPATAFSDVADVVSVKTDDELPMVVGGHAVNIWALAYSSRLGLQLQPYAPFTTKDLDLWGPKKILDSLAQKVPVVLGSTLTASCEAMEPLVKNGPVMYCFSPGIYPAALKATSWGRRVLAGVKSQSWVVGFRSVPIENGQSFALFPSCFAEWLHAA